MKEVVKVLTDRSNERLSFYRNSSGIYGAVDILHLDFSLNIKLVLDKTTVCTTPSADAAQKAD